MKKGFIIIVAAVLSLLSSTAMADSPKREFRSVWMAGMGIDWPYGKDSKTEADAKKRMRTYLDDLQAQNFTSVCVHVRPRADAYYKSTLEPWSADITGTRGNDPGWDPLAFAIEECHKRGLECYAWINPFRVNADSKTYTTDFDKEWREKGWLMKGVNGTWTIFNPGVPGARRHCLDVFKEIYMNYDIDGMLFDDYFYPGEGMPGSKNDAGNSGQDSESDDYQTWKDSKSKLSLYDWRRENVNSFIRELYDEIQAVRPDMRFGIGPAGVGHATAVDRGLPEPAITSKDWQYDKIFADCLAWLSDGSIDFISPQIYWARTHGTAPHAPLCEWWNMAADHYGRHCYTSVGAYKVATAEFGGNNVKGWSEIGAQIELARVNTKNNSAGQIYYNTKSINGPETTGLGNYIKENCYTSKALTPVVTWKTRVKYPAVSSAKLSGGTLSWNATEKKDRAIIRYTVYAVPATVDYAAAQAADGDGIDAKYLVDITYSPSYALPANKTVGYWYAICVYDGYGNESEPSFVNYSVERAPAVLLLEPAKGASVPWDASFAWSEVAGASYIMEVSTASDFSAESMELAAQKTTTATVSVDCMGSGADATLCYWRVATILPGMLASYSDVSTFKTPARKPAPTGTPLLPVNGSEIDETEIEFVWTPQLPEWQGCGYILKLEIFAKNAYGDYSKAEPVYTAPLNASAGRYKVPVSMLGKGEFVWRLNASGKRWTPNSTDPLAFNVNNLVVGSWEKGYLMKVDPDSYADNGEATLRSLWFRSVREPFGNMKFEEKGSFNRGMVAVDNCVYLSGRRSNDSHADIYLGVYDAFTGEHIKDLPLGDEGKVSYYPCNDVFKDSEGTVCISNLTLDLSATPLYVHKVDLKTGALTLVTRRQEGDAKSRVDHVGIYGDIDGEDFTLFVPVASSKQVYRWKNPPQYANGGGSSYKLGKFYPSDATSLGIAPRVVPVSHTQYYLDGGSTAWSFYSGSNLLASFAQAPEAAPANSVNGGTVFSLCGNDYIVYSYTAPSGGSRYALAMLDGSATFKGLKLMWIFPTDGLGNVDSATCSAPVDVVVRSDEDADIYIYSPGNGLAAYRFHAGTSGVGEVRAEKSLPGMRVHGRTVEFTTEVSEVVVSTLTGACVAVATDASSIELPAAGVFIVKADGLSKVIYVK